MIVWETTQTLKDMRDYPGILVKLNFSPWDYEGNKLFSHRYQIGFQVC